MSARDVTSTASRVIINNEIAKAGAEEIFASFGSTAKADELKAAVDAFSKPGVKMSPETAAFVRETLGNLQQLLQTKEEVNRRVARDEPRLEAEESARLKAGVPTQSFGGSDLSEALKEAVRTALVSGARPYDVRKLDDPEIDNAHGGGFQATGYYTPYPQEIAPRGSMAFGYTEITPKKIADDMATEQHYKQIAGYKSEQVNMPFGNGAPQQIQRPQYKDVVGKGTGNITAHYDEANHPEIYARGSSGQIWSNNCALLSDGTLHGLPAMRRSEFTRHILTNPSLARGQRMLANFHLEMRGGVITGVGISGRLQKLINDGELKIVNPLTILKAAGFAIAPNCRLNFEGRGPIPNVSEHVIG